MDYKKDEYINIINKITDYIQNNLDKNLSLKNVSKVAGFSEYHFHRIFKNIINETLNQFVKRLRVEKAAMLLVYNKKKTITEIAYECGFSSSATFARAFKEKFNVSATTWRKKKEGSINSKEVSKICKNINKNEKENNLFICYFDSVTNNYFWRLKMDNTTNLKVEVKTIEAMDLAYIRYIGPYKGNESLFEGLFAKLMKWAIPRELLNFPETKMLSIYHDNHNLTDDDKLRVSIAISIPKETKMDSDSEVSKMSIVGGKYAIGHFELLAHEYESAWALMFKNWLPESGFEIDERAVFELYLNNPKDSPDGKHIVDIYIPIKPL